MVGGPSGAIILKSSVYEDFQSWPTVQQSMHN